MTESPHPSALLAFARQLQRTATFAELVEAVQAEARAALGFNHAWLFVVDDDDMREIRLIEVVGSQSARVREVAPLLTVAGDPMLEEIVRGDAPVVVLDARTDPRTNKKIVEQLHNRTIINVPLRLLDKPLGALGVGTYGDEGVKAPTREELDHLVGMAAHVSVAAGRIRFVEERVRTDAERVALERRIFQMQKLESIGLLAGGIAHDFNNLLTVVLGGAALLRGAVAGASVGDLAAITSAAERGRELTQQLLAVSRSQPLRLEPLDLNDRIGQLLELVKRVLPEHIEIVARLGAGLPRVKGDRSQLDQVFMNLCINARDAMPSGGQLTIETELVAISDAYVQAHPWAVRGSYVVTSVSDNGIGMEPEVLDRVFEPFFSTKSERAGTGLGLAVSYGIVRQHHGMLHCYSELGVGTVFKVYLPVNAQDVVAGHGQAEGARSLARGDERILVAEDSPPVRFVIERVLMAAGYTVVAVDSGVEACRRAQAEHFDLAILDVVMPMMNGRETLARLRVIDPKLRFMFASGYAADTNALAFLAPGEIEVIEKPYDPDELLRLVRRVLDG